MLLSAFLKLKTDENSSVLVSRWILGNPAGQVRPFPSGAVAFKRPNDAGPLRGERESQRDRPVWPYEQESHGYAYGELPTVDRCVSCENL